MLVAPGHDMTLTAAPWRGSDHGVVVTTAPWHANGHGRELETRGVVVTVAWW